MVGSGAFLLHFRWFVDIDGVGNRSGYTQRIG
jgi:hypothetical protein